MSTLGRLGMYDDVKEVLDAALLAKGGTFELADHGKAVHWRQRAYKFRKLYASKLVGSSPYDQLTLPRIPKESAVVVINRVVTKGIFTPAASTEATAELEQAVQELIDRENLV